MAINKLENESPDAAKNGVKIRSKEIGWKGPELLNLIFCSLASKLIYPLVKGAEDKDV